MLTEDIEVSVADRGVIMAMIIYFIAHEPTIELIKLEAYFVVLNRQCYKSFGEYLFNWTLTANGRLRNFKRFIDFMVEKELIRLNSNERHFGLTIKCAEIIKRFPKMFQSINGLLEWVSITGEMVYPTSPTSVRISGLQIELDNYFDKQMQSHVRRGYLYEHFIGYLFEKEKYKVEYVGSRNKGKGDSGIDLICRSHTTTWIIQCKCWKRDIPPKEVRDLNGTVDIYRRKHPKEVVKGAFFTTSSFSKNAWNVANESGIGLYGNNILPKQFPVIKCCKDNNVYYLPTDREYDIVKLDYACGDFYCLRVIEAEKKGFKHVENQIYI